MRYFLIISSFLILSCGTNKNILYKPPKLYFKAYKTTKYWPYHKPLHHQKNIKFEPMQCPSMYNR